MDVTPLLFAMDASVAAVHVSLRGRGEAVRDDDSRDLRVPCCNAHPHVTVWIAEPGLARYSNQLLGGVVAASGGHVLVAGGDAKRGPDERFVVPLGGGAPAGREPGAGPGGEATGAARSGLGRVTVRGRVEFFW